jgi:hypothetical protein
MTSFITDSIAEHGLCAALRTVPAVSQVEGTLSVVAGLVTLSVLEQAVLAVVETIVEAVAGLEEPRVRRLHCRQGVQVAWDEIAGEVTD